MNLSLAADTILSPVPLFFVLGLLAALFRSQMTIPEAFAKGLAIYLMMAIGLKGGVEMAKNPFTLQIALVMVSAMALSFLIPVLAHMLIRATTKLSTVDSAATAAHYGSISIVTFVAATEAVKLAGLNDSGFMVAAAVLMETPAIITALLIAGKAGASDEKPIAGSRSDDLIREVLLNASVVVLVGSLIIGWVIGSQGMEKIGGFFIDPFQGVLCLFILDLGLAAGRGIRRGWRELSAPLLAFGIYMPLISACIAMGLAWLLALKTGDAALLITLSASASYIAVPAAIRLAMPKAKPSIYLTMSLGVTFPFNLTFGIPLYIMMAGMVGS